MTTKPAYQTDRAGRLIGQTVADESPLEPGVFLLPAGCTLTAPPSTVPAGQCPRWNGVKWDLVANPQPTAANDNNAVAKLQAFLVANPDVAAVLKQGSV